jgi:hypothetical protein
MACGVTLVGQEYDELDYKKFYTDISVSDQMPKFRMTVDVTDDS